MQKTSSRSLYNYWNELRGSRSAPDRRNIDPTKIRDCLAYTFILEATTPETFAFRLAGSHLCAAYGRELKSRSFAEFWHEKDQDAIQTLIRAVTDDHAVALVTFTGKTDVGTEANFEMALMPLLHNGATDVRILGSMTAIDEPYWFGVQPVTAQRIGGLRLIWPDAVGERFDTAEVPDDFTGLGVREASTGAIDVSGPDGSVRRRYAHLTVIDGGRQ